MVYSLPFRRKGKLCLQSTFSKKRQALLTVYRIVIVLVLLVPCTLSLVTSVFAHVLKTDGTIGAVLHIDPEDDPIVNQPAGFFFEFKDTQNKFDPANCDCNFTILQSEKQIYTQPLFQGNDKPSLDNASVFYTFPQRDIYQLIISGAPKTAGAFSNFKLVYDIRIDRVGNPPAVTTPASPTQTAGNWVSTHVVQIIGVIVLAIFLIGAILNQRFVRK